jgi:3'-phosphoadenosine 5'-phosphosulfate sulfotransferase (PAPS reductase)/FAD synthetase
MVANYGGGVNTVAMLILLRNSGERPDWIVMADPGSEWPQTYAYRDQVMRPWLARHGFPDVTVVARQAELAHRKGAKNFETLAGLCERE